MEYLSVVFQEVYKILFLLIPVLVSVAMKSSMFNYLNLQKEKQIKENKKDYSGEFKNEKLTIDIKPYYFSNIIARCSKTMIECNNSKLNLKSTGTEG